VPTLAQRAAAPMEFRLFRQAFGGALPLPPSPAMRQAAAPDRPGPAADRPGGLALIATAFAAVATPGPSSPLAAEVSGPPGIAALALAVDPD
jgi:hypothetical protein